MNKNFLFTALFCTALTLPAGAFAQKIIEATHWRQLFLP
jgi:hypothetical protein